MVQTDAPGAMFCPGSLTTSGGHQSSVHNVVCVCDSRDMGRGIPLHRGKCGVLPHMVDQKFSIS